MNTIGVHGNLLLLALCLGSIATTGTGWTEMEDPLTKETFVFKKANGLEIKADAYGIDKTQTKPVIVNIHGGALIVGHRGWTGGGILPGLVEAGYVVVCIDYRLAPETKLEGIIQDLKDAFSWVREEGPHLLNIDPDKLGVIGSSAGGYLTLMSGFCVTPRPKALVSYYGYGDIVGDWYGKPDPFYCQQEAVPKEEAYSVVGGSPLSEDKGGNKRGRFYLYCRQNGLWLQEVSGHDPHIEPEYFVRFCPVRNVDAAYPPTILLHGDADTDVPYGQSVLMANELERIGVVHEFITIPGGPHGFDHQDGGLKNPRNREVFDRVLAFLETHLERE